MLNISGNTSHYPTNVTTLLRTLALGMILAACATSGGAARAAEVSPELGRSAHQLAETTCSNCHGASGHSISPTFPNLAGQTAPYLQAQLHAFRDQTRGDPDALSYMWGMASQLSDATIEALSTYYAEQAPSRAKTGDEKLMARGKQIFEEGVTAQGTPACATCHGIFSRSSPVSMPTIW